MGSYREVAREPEEWALRGQAGLGGRTTSLSAPDGFVRYNSVQQHGMSLGGDPAQGTSTIF